MNKKIIQELLIIFLLSLVIVLTFKMVIYDFIPSESSLPKPFKYTADALIEETLQEIKKENETNKSEESILKSYMIEENDLKSYVSKNGKINPFSDYVKTNR